MEKITKVGFKEFSRYVQSLKNSSNPCDFCGEHKWMLTTTMEHDVGGKMTTLAFSLPYSAVSAEKVETPGELMINNAMPILIKQCSNCGNMTFFNHDIVLRQINSQIEGGDW